MQTTRSTWATTALQLSAAITALISLSACAETNMPVSSSMRLGAATFAPQGYLRFCERRPDQCGLPAPIAESDRANLERVLNQQQWANVFNLQPTSIGHDAASAQTEGLAEATPITLDASFGGSQTPAETSAAADIVPSDDTSPAGPLADAAPTPVQAATATVTAAVMVTARAPTLQAVLPPQGKAVLHMTPMVWAALNGVNQSVNAKIRPMSDEQAFGMSDYWTLPLSDGPRPVGNCKHYALEKRKALVDAGFSPDALSLAIVKTGWGEVHAVLVVGTDQGDYVLDNLSTWIKGWQEVRYTWIERQTPGAPLRWAALAPNMEAVARAS